MEDKLIKLIGKKNAERLVRLVELNKKLWKDGLPEPEDAEFDKLREQLDKARILP